MRSEKSATNEITLKQFIISCKKWINHLWLKRTLIISLVIFGMILGFVYSKFSKVKYIAKSNFVFEDLDSGSGLAQYAGLASIAGIDVGSSGGIFQSDNILELYKSRSMIEKALLSPLDISGQNEKLIDHYVRIYDLKRSWKKKKLGNINFNVTDRNEFSRVQDSIIGEIVENIRKNNLSINKPDKKLGIIEVRVESLDETFSKLFNNKIVETVNDFYVETKTKKSVQNIRILEQKTDSVRAQMTGAIYRSSNINDATPNLNPTRQTQRVAPVQASQFSAETNKLLLGELVKNLELSKINLRKESPLIQIIDEPIYPLQKQFVSAVKGIVLGGLIFGVITVFVLTFRLVFKRILSSE